MLNRLIAYLNEIKTISDDKIYFHNGNAYSGSTLNIDSLFYAKCDYSADTTAKGFFDGKTFYIVVPRFKEFVDKFKKNFDHIEFDGNTIVITTTIPDVELRFEWTHEDDKHLERVLEKFDSLQANLKEDKFIAERIYNKDEMSSFKDQTAVAVEGRKLLMIVKKYIGHITSTTALVHIKIYHSDDAHKDFVEILVQNSKLKTYHYGCFINF